MKTLVPALLACTGLCACASSPVQHKAGVLDYLYPAGTAPAPAADVNLQLPLRVGVAFAPDDGSGTTSSSNFWMGDLGYYQPMLDASEKQRLLERVVAAFQGVADVQSIEIIPESYLKPSGGFENVDQLRGLLGLDLIALLSFEQTQFQDYGKASLSYLTLVGAYLIEGNENETHTFVDTSVFDIPSRALLFNAGGRSRVKESSTALEASENLRNDSSKGFEKAIDQMIAELKVALGAFREQAQSGTVRGAGTPNLQVSGGQGAGAAGWLELAVALFLVGTALGGTAIGRRTPAA